MWIMLLGHSIFEKQVDPNGVYINTTSSVGWSRDLSPFIIGPCDLYGGHVSQWKMDGNSQKYIEGWQDRRAHRYPMWKGARPEYSWWDGQKLGYIEVRKRIYVPLYSRAVVKTEGYKRLEGLYKNNDQKTIS